MTAPYRLRLGYLPLTDSAPLIVARQLGLDRRHGLELELLRQPSWSAVRDKLLDGRLHAAAALYGLAYGMKLGLAGPQADMALLMTLNQNGQAITLSHPLADALTASPEQALRRRVRQDGPPLTLAHTFPAGTHALWLNYWLAAQGLDPRSDARLVVIPPPQMGAALEAGQLDGFCAGEPWHQQAAARQAGRIVVVSGEIWPGHPEKALLCRRDFAQKEPAASVTLIMTLLEACRWLEHSEHRRQAARWLARPEHIGLPETLIAATLPSVAAGATALRFFDQGRVNYPYPSDGIWFVDQFRRWGWLRGDEDAQTVAAEVSQTRLYRQAADALGLPLPARPQHSGRLCDGVDWDGQARYPAALGLPG